MAWSFWSDLEKHADTIITGEIKLNLKEGNPRS